MQFLPIVFATDDNYFKYTAVVITSVLYNRNKNTQYEFHILCENLSNANKDYGKTLIKKHKNTSIHFHELKDIDISQFHLNSYMSAATYFRFFIPELFPNYERILYLDSDLIVDADISELAIMDFEGKAIIGCPSPYIVSKIALETDNDYPRSYFREVLKMPKPEEYFNAGVLLFNLKLMREKDIQAQLFRAIEEIPAPKLQDQDLLNSVIARNGGPKLIDQRYNMTRQYKITKKRLWWNAFRKRIGWELPKSDKLFFIYHYVGKDKPWQKDSIDSELFYWYKRKVK